MLVFVFFFPGAFSSRGLSITIPNSVIFLLKGQGQSLFLGLLYTVECLLPDTCVSSLGGRQAAGREGPTFDSHVDALADGELGLDENTAQVLPLIHALLHIRQLESPVLKHHLAVVIGEQQGILVPLDGVVGVANDPAVDECVPPGDCCDVPHCPDAGGSWGVCGGEKEERRGRWRHEPVPLCGGVLFPCLAPETTPGMRDFPGEGRGSAFSAKCRRQDWGHPWDS